MHGLFGLSFQGPTAIAIAARVAGAGCSGAIVDAARAVTGKSCIEDWSVDEMWLTIFLTTAAISLCFCLAAVMFQAKGDTESRVPWAK